MILVDKPYVSDFLKETARANRIPIIKTAEARALGITEGAHLLSDKEAVARLKGADSIRLYTTTENAIGWIARHLAFTDLPEKIGLFKNKVRFRELLKPLTPDFHFKEVAGEDLDGLNLEEVPLPFVIKPAVGFFSMGVHKVATPGEWDAVRESIEAEIGNVRDLYPSEVIDAATFIIEEAIEGEEFAIDAYFDAEGAPVIVGIFHHLFASGEDVNDRVYYTSEAVVRENLEEFTRFLGAIGTLTGVRNFPVHVELRRTAGGALIPIEINPMRFGGWCSTPDLTFHAYGINPYLMYFTQQRPDWDAVLEGKEGKRYCIIVLDNTTGIEGGKIARFDYDRLLSRFDHPLELRRIDYTAYPVFGFVFTETSEDNLWELEQILRSDLREFVTLKEG